MHIFCLFQEKNPSVAWARIKIKWFAILLPKTNFKTAIFQFFRTLDTCSLLWLWPTETIFCAYFGSLQKKNYFLWRGSTIFEKKSFNYFTRSEVSNVLTSQILISVKKKKMCTRSIRDNFFLGDTKRYAKKRFSSWSESEKVRNIVIF